MTTQLVDDWRPEQWNGPVVTYVNQTSFIETQARGINMTTWLAHVPRSGGVTLTSALPKGGTYTSEAGSNDELTIEAKKVGAKEFFFAEEDVADTASLVNLVNQKQMEWARAYAILLDQACLGVTSNSVTASAVPFQSVYAALTNNNSDTSYTANANLTVAASASGPTYAELVAPFQDYEEGGFDEPGRGVVVAHPSFKAILRKMVGTGGDLIFQQSTNGNLANATGPLAGTLFGYPLYWSYGARKHATATSAPTGKALLFVGNTDLLIRGDRSGPEFKYIPANAGGSHATDEDVLKGRSRKGFAIGNENGWACLELA